MGTKLNHSGPILFYLVSPEKTVKAASPRIDIFAKSCEYIKNAVLNETTCSLPMISRPLSNQTTDLNRYLSSSIRFRQK